MRQANSKANVDSFLFLSNFSNLCPKSSNSFADTSSPLTCLVYSLKASQVMLVRSLFLSRCAWIPDSYWLFVHGVPSASKYTISYLFFLASNSGLSLILDHRSYRWKQKGVLISSGNWEACCRARLQTSWVHNSVTISMPFALFSFTHSKWSSYFIP